MRKALVILLGATLGIYLMAAPFAAPAYAACPLKGGFYGMNDGYGMNDDGYGMNQGYGKLNDMWGPKFGRHGNNDLAWRMAAYRQHLNQQTGCANGSCATDCTSGNCSTNCKDGACNANCPNGNCNTDCTNGTCDTAPGTANSTANTPIDAVKNAAAVLGFDAKTDSYTLTKQDPAQAIVEVVHNGQTYSLTLVPAATGAWQITSMNQTSVPVVSLLTNEVTHDLNNEVNQELSNEVKQELGEAKA